MKKRTTTTVKIDMPELKDILRKHLDLPYIEISVKESHTSVQRPGINPYSFFSGLEITFSNDKP